MKEGNLTYARKQGLAKASRGSQSARTRGCKGLANYNWGLRIWLLFQRVWKKHQGLANYKGGGEVVVPLLCSLYLRSD